MTDPSDDAPQGMEWGCEECSYSTRDSQRAGQHSDTRKHSLALRPLRGDWGSETHSFLAGAIIACLQVHLPGTLPFDVVVPRQPDTDENGIYRKFLRIEVPDEQALNVYFDRVVEGVYEIRVEEDV